METTDCDFVIITLNTRIYTMETTDCDFIIITLNYKDIYTMGNDSL